MQTDTETTLPFQNVNIEIQNQLSLLCRLCLSNFKADQMESIFQPFADTTVAQYVINLTQIQITKEDCFSKLICQNCLKKLQELEKFKQSICNSDVLLQRTLVYSGVVDQKLITKPVVLIILPDKLPPLIPINVAEPITEINNDPILPVKSEEIWTEDNDDDSKIDIVKHEIDLDPLPETAVAAATASSAESPQESANKDLNEEQDKDEVLDQLPVKKKRSHYTCKLCNTVCNSWSGYKGHLSKHTGIYHKCTICNKKFAMKYRLVMHKATHGRTERPYKCEECGKRLSTKQSYTHHIESHKKTKSYQCEDCGKCFSHVGTFWGHWHYHRQKRQLTYTTCSVCNKRISEMNYKRHLQIHENRTYLCEQCNMTFKRQSNLDEHLKKHLGQYRFECDLCPKKYSNRNSFEYHKKTHTNIKQYSCEFCEKMFSHRSGWNAHGRVHAKKNPITCTLCQKKFGYTEQLKGHMKKVHGIDEKA